MRNAWGTGQRASAGANLGSARGAEPCCSDEVLSEKEAGNDRDASWTGLRGDRSRRRRLCGHDDRRKRLQYYAVPIGAQVCNRGCHPQGLAIARLVAQGLI